MAILVVGLNSGALFQALRAQLTNMDVTGFAFEDMSEVDSWLNSLEFPPGKQYHILVEMPVLGSREEAPKRFNRLERTIPLQARQIGTQVYLVYKPEEVEQAGKLAGDKILSLQGLLSNPKLQLGL